MMIEEDLMDLRDVVLLTAFVIGTVILSPVGFAIGTAVWVWRRW